MYVAGDPRPPAALIPAPRPGCSTARPATASRRPSWRNSRPAAVEAQSRPRRPTSAWAAGGGSRRAVPAALPGLRIGQNVEHPKFGLGVIVATEGRGDAPVQVNFGGGGHEMADFGGTPSPRCDRPAVVPIVGNAPPPQCRRYS